MYFWQQQRFPERALEIYRALAKDDTTNPLPVLARAGWEKALMQLRQDIEGASKARTIESLVEEMTRYLTNHPGGNMEAVLAGITHWRAGASTMPKPQHLPALSHLPDALAAMADRRLAEAITAAAPLLRWITYDGYPIAEIGNAFAEGHAFATVIGEGSFYPAVDFDLGLFLIAPRTLYRDHKHAAPELYAPLTGPHGWRFLPDHSLRVLPADVPVWNAPFAPHATITGDVPFLCIFCWTSDVNATATVIPCDDWDSLLPAMAASKR